MSNIETGGPAFPYHGAIPKSDGGFTILDEYGLVYSGMTLHDAFMIAALPAVIQACHGDTLREEQTREQLFAENTVRVANAMIQARKENQ